MFEFIGQFAVWCLFMFMVWAICMVFSKIIEKNFDLDLNQMTWVDFILVMTSTVISSFWYWS